MNRLTAFFATFIILIAAIPGLATAAPDGGHDLRIVTLNLYHDKAEWPKRRPQVIAALRKLKPDAIALQEVIQTEETANQARDIAKALGYSVHFVSTDPAGQVRRYGNAILTRTRMRRMAETRLKPLNDSRTAASAEFGRGKRKIAFFATHLNYENNANGQAIRREQTSDLVEFIKAQRRGVTVIVAGDFNTVANAPELEAVREEFVSGYDQVHPDAVNDERAHSTLNDTYFSKPEDLRRIDHVFFDPRTLRAVHAKRLFTEPDASGVWATDHFGVVVDFKFKR